MGTTTADAVCVNISLVKILQWMEVRIFANSCIESIRDFLHSSFHSKLFYCFAQSYKFIPRSVLCYSLLFNLVSKLLSRSESKVALILFVVSATVGSCARPTRSEALS